MYDLDRTLYVAPAPEAPAPFDLGQTMLKARDLRAQALKGMLARAFAGRGPGARLASQPLPCGCTG